MDSQKEPGKQDGAISGNLLPQPRIVSLAISSSLVHLPFFDLLTEDNGQSKILVVHLPACDEAELKELWLHSEGLGPEGTLS